MITLLRPLSILALSLVGACAGMSSATNSAAESRVIVQAGSADAFLRARCFARVELYEEGAHVSRPIVDDFVRTVALPHCANSEANRLTLVYQAGPGVCIDCGDALQGQWSGFAFLTVSGDDDVAIASVEWQGSNAESATQLRRLFMSSVEQLLRP
jgi:hypothetical protein